MKRLAVLFLFFLTSYLCAFDEPEANKSAGEVVSPTRVDIVNHAEKAFLPKVNPISGEYVEEEVDLVVAGCEPLSFRRFYGHMNISDRRYGIGWRVNPESSFFA